MPRRRTRVEAVRGAKPDAPLAGPQAVFKAAARRLGGAARLAEYLGCARSTAYNLVNGRKRWSEPYLAKARQLLGEKPEVPVFAHAPGNAEGEPYSVPRPDTENGPLCLDAEGAWLVTDQNLWPLAGPGQYVLFRAVLPSDLNAGDIVMARVPGNLLLVKTWNPAPKAGLVYLVSPFRGPQGYREELIKPWRIAELKDLRKVVGIWLG